MMNKLLHMREAHLLAIKYITARMDALDAVGNELAHRQNLHGEVVARQMAAAKRKGEPT